jgi:endonuclease/exonuclease/phosphatase family metal-dependent hydrolase
MLEVRIMAPGDRSLTLFITHLDHRSENYRLDQFRSAESLLGRSSGQPHIIVGDFNALAESDYVSSEELAELSSLHSERGWSPPEFGLIRSILAAGYCDAAAACCTGPRATWPAQGPERRVDYFFLSPELVDQLVDCRPIVSTRALQGSDHLPLVLDLEFR